MKNKLLLIILVFFILVSCGTGSKGVFGSGVSIALDPRTLGTQIDDSIMQKHLTARLALKNKKYLLSIDAKVLDGRIFYFFVECQTVVPMNYVMSLQETKKKLKIL